MFPGKGISTNPPVELVSDEAGNVVVAGGHLFEGVSDAFSLTVGEAEGA